MQVQSKDKEKVTNLPMRLMLQLHLWVVVGNFLCVSDVVSTYITAEVRALQCAKCVANWKCNECLNIGLKQFEKTWCVVGTVRK